MESAGEEKATHSRWRQLLPALAFLLFGLFSIYSVTAPRIIGNILEGSLEDALDKPVEVSGVRFNPLTRKVAIRRILIHYPESTGAGRIPYAMLDDARVTGLGGLLSGEREIDSLTVDEITIFLLRNEEARLWDTPRAATDDSPPRERSEPRERERTPREREPFAIPFRSVSINRAVMHMMYLDARIAPTEFTINGLTATRDPNRRDEATLNLARGEWLYANREVVGIDDFTWRFSMTDPEASIARLEIEMERTQNRPRIAQAWRAAERFFEKPERDRDEPREERMEEIFAAFRETLGTRRSEQEGDDPAFGFELRLPAIVLRSMLPERVELGASPQAQLDYRIDADGRGVGSIRLPGLMLEMRTEFPVEENIEPGWEASLTLDEFRLADYLNAFLPVEEDAVGPRVRSALATGTITSLGEGGIVSGEGSLVFAEVNVEPDPRPLAERIRNPSPLAPFMSVLRGAALGDDPTRTRVLEWSVPPTAMEEPLGAALLHAMAIQAAATGVAGSEEPVPVDTTDPFAF